jgi:hypothetical protein
MRARINRTLSAVAEKVAKISERRPSEDRGAKTASAHAFIQADPAAVRNRIVEHARLGKLPETIEALSAATEVPEKAVWNLVKQGAEDGVMILCKAAGLGWPEVRSVLEVTNTGKHKRTLDHKKGLEKYLKFSANTAQRVVRFLKLRKAISKAELLKVCEE